MGLHDDIPFTEVEVTTVVKNLRKDIAPGPDGIKTTLVQAIYKRHTQFFLNLFNACLRTVTSQTNGSKQK